MKSEAEMGRAALVAGELNSALNHLCKAARLSPDAQIWLDLAATYQKLGRGNVRIAYLDSAVRLLDDPSIELRQALDEARDAFLKANPNILEVQRLYVKNPNAPRIKSERHEFFTLVNKGQPKAAFELGLKQYRMKRVDPLIQGVWASLAVRNGERQMGLNAIFAAYLRTPSDWVTVNNIADILCQFKNTRNALDFALAAVNLNPGLSGAWVNLAAAFENQGSHWEAAKACREAVKINPDDGLAWTNLGNSLKNSGRAAEAAQAYREAVRLQPDNLALWSNYLFGMLYDENASEEDIAREAFKFGEYWEPKIKPIDHSSRLKEGMPKKLRIGFVSADIRSHPVAYFFEPLLEHIDRDQFEIYIYDNQITEDFVTRRFKGYADKWKNISSLHEPAFVKLIINDKIDVLVDMSGHTGRNRLLAFAHKPAPVQVTWLGHPATTGLKRMDWRITDHLVDPKDTDRYYSETLFRLDRPTCYAPLVKSPALRADPRYAVSPAPALLNGFVTFGSCNNLAKINGEVISCWSDILKRVPNSKLLLESPGLLNLELREKLHFDFAQQDITSDRLILHTRDSSLQYLRYHDIDIALDPFPYGGGTTSCDLLWMGLPLVTLPSVSNMGKAGSSLLTYLGRTEWIASSVENYAEIATELASDIFALNAARYEQRSRMQRSVLMDGPAYAQKFGLAITHMFNEAVANA